MDYTEYIPSLQDVGWRAVQAYTWISMMWHRYILSNWVDVSNDSDDYPFAMIQKDGLFQVYYPEIIPTDYKFISGVVRVNDRDEYDLTLTPFFVDGNRILNRDFMRWYLKINYSKNLDTSDNYVIYIMDHNIEQITVEQDECIKLNKDNYLKIKSDE